MFVILCGAIRSKIDKNYCLILFTIIEENSINEPAHEIMALLVLRKPIFQTRIRSHPVGLDV